MWTEMCGDRGGSKWRQRWRYVETEVAVCGDRGGGMWRQRQEYAEMEMEVCGDRDGSMRRRRWKYAEAEMEVCRDGDGSMRRWRWKYAEMENASRYYVILTTSTIYSKLVLIVKERDMSILSTQTGLVKSGAMYGIGA
jgi:hypothetical protein